MTLKYTWPILSTVNVEINDSGSLQITLLLLLIFNVEQYKIQMEGRVGFLVTLRRGGGGGGGEYFETSRRNLQKKKIVKDP